MSKAYAFSFGQRVNVPGQDGVQGLISAPTHTGEMHMPIIGIAMAPLTRHAYLVRFLLEDGTPACSWFGDFDLAFANPEPEPSPQIERATVIATLSDAVDKINANRKGKGRWVHVPNSERKTSRKSKFKLDRRSPPPLRHSRKKPAPKSKSKRKRK